MRITFIYRMHTPEARRPLWQYILEASEEQRGNPWVIMGDFNVVLRPSDREGGDRFWHSHNDEFMDCINQAEVQQIPYNGMRLTWHNGQQGPNAIMEKLDWILCNEGFANKWRLAKATFLPMQDSDHNAMVLNLHPK